MSGQRAGMKTATNRNPPYLTCLPQPTAKNHNQAGCGFHTQYENRNPPYLTCLLQPTATSLI